jgi:hypothetical protein
VSPTAELLPTRIGVYIFHTVGHGRLPARSHRSMPTSIPIFGYDLAFPGYTGVANDRRRLGSSPPEEEAS